jgi:hypothetical protein
MTPSELKRNVEQSELGEFFFTRKTMGFFGDTMANYGVRDAGDSWELHRKKPVKYGLQSSHFFKKLTFEHFCKINGEIT